jgi:hypothetical protein
MYLPLSRQSDFILHFFNAGFHVHQLVLQHHLAYFRTLFEAFPPPRDVYVSAVSGGERKGCRAYDEDRTPAVATTNTATQSPSVVCTHSPLVQCIRLPDRIGRQSCSEDELLFFLRHFYLATSSVVLHFTSQPISSMG